MNIIMVDVINTLVNLLVMLKSLLKLNIVLVSLQLKTRQLLQLLVQLNFVKKSISIWVSFYRGRKLESNHILGNTFACRSCSSIQASANLAGSYDAGDYLEIEFSGFVDFKSLPDPIKEVRHMTGNVWQILFSDWYDFSTNRLNFELELAFIGSPGMAPKVNWSRMCQQVRLRQ